MEKIWKRFFCKEEVAKAPTPIPEEEVIVAPTPYDYGLSRLGIFLRSKDYGWSEPDETHKMVVLTNPAECKEKISLMGMMSAWKGTGHGEWEAILGAWFIEAVLEALENESDEADITHLFNRDFFAFHNKEFTQEQVYNHLIKWFDIVEETDEIQKLRIHI